MFHSKFIFSGVSCVKSQDVQDCCVDGLAEKYREKTWLFALEGSWEPYTYLNAETGQLKGFLLDLIYEACLRCDMKCDTIYIGENIQSCFNPMNYTAEGLFNRYFDGCVGWGPTALRKNVLAFSSPLTKAPLARLYTRATSGITRPDEAVAGKTVGFRAFWFTDKLCARYNLLPQLRDEDVRNIEVTNGWEDLLTQLVQRDVDLILLPDGYKGTEDLVAVGEAFSCTEGPLSLMHRKDVDLSWFGKCVQDLYRVDRYHTLCTNWDVKTCLSTF
ncbi:unnamed protein product [Owenia fusiformis]|uniref:Uncharacterized protein n=1 Tax=Owenia fusiformis TaxID=6347 RepID=A0A8S4NAZ4_OWEFU|nr:unnamed protein product [Owenia fusiformis]